MSKFCGVGSVSVFCIVGISIAGFVLGFSETGFTDGGSVSGFSVTGRVGNGSISGLCRFGCGVGLAGENSSGGCGNAGLGSVISRVINDDCELSFTSGTSESRSSWDCVGLTKVWVSTMEGGWSSVGCLSEESSGF